VTYRDTSSNPSRPQDTPLQRFGATLRSYRQQRRLSQQALAERAGIRRAYISQIETGLRNISVLTLLRITHALSIPSAWLLTRLDTHAPLAPPAANDSPPPRGLQEAVATQDDTRLLPPDDSATLLHLLGATLRQHRQQQGLYQAALATMTGLSLTYIIEIEQGRRNLSVLSLVRIADALGLSVAHLLAPLETHQRLSPPRTQ
jgi:transcriptional regulator with XRE-family HTH domain